MIFSAAAFAVAVAVALSSPSSLSSHFVGAYLLSFSGHFHDSDDPHFSAVWVAVLEKLYH